VPLDWWACFASRWREEESDKPTVRTRDLRIADLMNMIELRCTVRGCGKELSRNDRSLRCPDRHSFDRAREGYWNLTQPQDKKSSNPGDSEDAVMARHRWLQRGHAEGLIESLREWTAVSTDSSRGILDLGCGEGTFGKALFSSAPELYCGIDLSRKAIRLASRGWPSATWVLANADRTLPIADQSVQKVMSLFGRRPVQEIGRVLAKDGELIVGMPGEDDLIELREEVHQSGIRRSRWEAIVDEMKAAGLVLSQHKLWSEQIDLGAEEIADAMAMTYRAVRHSESARLERVIEKKVTLAADLLLFRRDE
jgi:23S rRNA (guanine745-N1)-methyltransferase